LGSSPFIAPSAFEGTVIKRMFAFGGWVQLSGIMVLINAETNVVIIAAVVGLSAAGLFDLGNRLARLVRIIAFYTNSAVFPVLSRLDAESGNASVRALFVTATRGMALVSVLAFCALVGTTPAVLHLWLGSTTANGDLVLLIVFMLGIGYCADNVASVGATILRAIGRPRLETLYQVVAAGINITLTLLLAKRFGVPGILIGPLSGALISSVIFLRLIGRDFGFPASRVVAPWLLPLIITGTLSATAAFAAGTLLPHGPSRIAAAGVLTVEVIAFGVTALLGLRLTNLLDASDRERLRLIVPAALTTLLFRARKSAA
jgi:O-antigen/teichoic acid export membrane protein